MKTFVISMAAICLFVATGCDESKEKAKEAVQAAKDMTKSAGDAVSDLVAKGKDAVVKAAMDHGVDIDKVIADLKSKAGSLSGDAKAKFDEGLKALDVDRGALTQKIDAMKAAGGEGWKDFVKEIQALVTKMKATIADLTAKLK